MGKGKSFARFFFLLLFFWTLSGLLNKPMPFGAGRLGKFFLGLCLLLPVMGCCSLWRDRPARESEEACPVRSAALSSSHPAQPRSGSAGPTWLRRGAQARDSWGQTASLGPGPSLARIPFDPAGLFFSLLPHGLGEREDETLTNLPSFSSLFFL